MWDGLLMLLFLSVIMGTASFLAGFLPLSLTLSTQQLRLITALGTGVLVGTSLIVIIPEGVETIYKANGNGGVQARSASTLVVRQAEVLNANEGSFGRDAWRRHDSFDAVSEFEIASTDSTVGGSGAQDGFYHPYSGQGVNSVHYAVNRADRKEQKQEDDKSKSKGQAVASDEGNKHSSGLKGEHQEKHDPHVWVGVSLILGFVLMYLIDTLPRYASLPTQPQRFHISLGQFSFTRPRSVSTASVPEMHMNETPAASSRASSTTVGLVIHAAADGIALGASSTNTTGNLSFIIFVAIMIHKAPAAFGLTTVLLKQGLTKRQARSHLVIFALAAPVGALVTWMAIHLLGLSSSSPGSAASNDFATGVLLLFSAGTFLYVAMHTMQENNSDGHEHGTNGYAGVPMTDMYAGGSAMLPPKPRGPTLLDTGVTVVGMFLPLLAQWGDMH